MKKIYWESLEVERHKFYFTVSEKGLNFVSSPEEHLSELFNFYPVSRYQIEFIHDEEVTDVYKDQFADFLDNKAVRFNIPIDVSEVGTEFQHIVWKQIMEIPYGKTTTYQQLAADIGRPKSVRAVAHATALNPLLMVIPCHRVIHSNGDLGDYRGGQNTKKALLELEQQTPKTGLISKIPLPKLI